MNAITVEHAPSQRRLKKLGVLGWPIWTEEASRFPWSCDEQECCYFLEGDVLVTPDGGQPVQMGTGDLVTFPKGMSCMWIIRKYVRKQHTFG